MKTLFSLSILLGLLACKTSSAVKGDGTGQTIELNKKSVKTELATLGYSKINKDSLQTFTIDTAYIVGNVLHARVQYGGGCKEHFYSLEGNVAMSKSLPPIRSMRFIHTSEPDYCKAIVMKNLAFDLTELAYKKEIGSQIRLNLEGYKEELMYTFSEK